MKMSLDIVCHHYQHCVREIKNITIFFVKCKKKTMKNIFKKENKNTNITQTDI